jgi:hypothetical protein
MAAPKKKTKSRPRTAAKSRAGAPKRAAEKKPAQKAKQKPAPAARPAAKPAPPPARSEAPKAPAAAAAPARPPGATKGAGTSGGAKGAAPQGKAAGGRPTPKKGGRRSPLSQRRGPNGELFTPGDLLLPGGPQGGDELQYFFRGCVAAEHAAGEVGIEEVLAKRGSPGGDSERGDLGNHVRTMVYRFDTGPIEPLLPPRPQAARRNFQGVIERAKYRRREIGAFLRGLDLGRTETSHMDSHGEASLQSLMEWAARLENLAESDEPEHADYAQFHRGLDQLENTTEALIIDVEQTLRRLRDRAR